MLLCVAAGVMRSCRCVTGWCGIKAQLQLKAWDTAGEPHALGIQLLAYRVHGMFTSPPRFRSRMSGHLVAFLYVRTSLAHFQWKAIYRFRSLSIGHYSVCLSHFEGRS